MKRRFLDRILPNGTGIPVVFTMYQKVSFDCGVFALSGEIYPHLAYLVFSIMHLPFFALSSEISHAFEFCMFRACPIKGIVMLQLVLPTICY